MATKRVLLELNPAGLREFLRENDDVRASVDEVAEGVQRSAEQLAHALGHPEAEFSAKGFRGADRYRVHVATANPAAMIAEAQERALLRAMNRGVAGL